MDCLASEVERGLSSNPKFLPIWYRYNFRGSQLSDNTLDSDGYYMHRAELDVLKGHAKDILDHIPSPAVIMDMGSGNAVKTRHIIDAVLENQTTVKYHPVDISSASQPDAQKQLLHLPLAGKEPTAYVLEYMSATCDKLLTEYGTKIEVCPVPGDYLEGIKAKSSICDNTLILWFGSIQSETVEQQISLLQKLSASMNENDRLLATLDITQDPEKIHGAYGLSDCNIPFYKNSLHRLSKDFANGQIDESKFSLKYEYVQNTQENATSFACPYLVSLSQQEYTLNDLGMKVKFEPGEPLYLSEWKGISHKYTSDQLTYLAKMADLQITRTWSDVNNHVAVICMKSVNPSKQ